MSDLAIECNPSSVEDWVDSYSDSLLRFALQRVRNTQTAEDLVQETLLAGWKARARFAGRSSVSTWLFSILRNKLTDYFRRANRVTLESELSKCERLAAEQSSVAKHHDSPPVAFEAEEFWHELYSCLERLPPKLADAYVLREIESLSTAEVCKILQITQSNLAMRLYRARVALQESLNPIWFER